MPPGWLRTALAMVVAGAVGAMVCLAGFGPPAAGDAALRADLELMRAQLERQQRALEANRAFLAEVAGRGGFAEAKTDSKPDAVSQAAAATLAEDELGLQKWVCPLKDLPKDVVTDKVTGTFIFVKKATHCYGLQLLLTTSFFYYFSIVLILQWHVRFRFNQLISCMTGWDPMNVKPMCTWRKLGLNILILAIYFHPSRRSTKPFVCSLMLIFIDTVALYYFMAALAWVLKSCTRMPMHHTLDEVADPCEDTEDDGYTDDKDFATNKYEDLTVRLRQLIPIFFVQLALISFYIEELNDGGDDHDIKAAEGDITKVDAVYWIVAVMFQMYGGGEQLGEAFSKSVWRKLILSTHPWLRKRCMKDEEWEYMVKQDRDSIIESMTNFADIDHPEFYLPCRRGWLQYKDEVRIRCFMDFVINGLARSTIMYTFPIMLCVEGPLDFVKDCTAVLFISTLDDVDPGVSLLEITTKLKYCLYYRQYKRKRATLDRAYSHAWAPDSALLPLDEFVVGDMSLDTCQKCLLTEQEHDYATKTANADSFAKYMDYSKEIWEKLLHHSKKELEKKGSAAA